MIMMIRANDGGAAGLRCPCRSMPATAGVVLLSPPLPVFRVPPRLVSLLLHWQQPGSVLSCQQDADEDVVGRDVCSDHSNHGCHAKKSPSPKIPDK